jgi:hypothetical protein
VRILAKFWRIVLGLFLVILGIAITPLPGPGGIFFIPPGLILLAREVPYLRKIILKLARRVPLRVRRWFRLKTGWHLKLKKKKRKNKAN